jgi:hypothetical protein
MSKPLSVATVLYDGFDLIDVFGPLEMFGIYPDHYYLHLSAERAACLPAPAVLEALR